MGIFVAIPQKFRPLQYGNESIGSVSPTSAAFRNTGLFQYGKCRTPFSEIRIHLDELMNLHLSDYVYFELKGFMNPVHVTDFPIRAIMLF